MLKIYHARHSRSMRVVWLCEELGIDYTLEHLAMFTPEMKTEAYLALNPLGKVPTIDDGGFVLWETNAILSYLDARYGGGKLIPPADTPAGARCLQWMGYGENPLTVIMGEVAAHGGPMPEERRVPALVDRGREIAPALVGAVERALGDATWMLGDDFSAADIMLGFGLNIARHLGFVGEDTPRCLAYCERLAARPAFQRAAAA